MFYFPFQSEFKVSSIDCPGRVLAQRPMQTPVRQPRSARVKREESISICSTRRARWYRYCLNRRASGIGIVLHDRGVLRSHEVETRKENLSAVSVND